MQTEEGCDAVCGRMPKTQLMIAHEKNCCSMRSRRLPVLSHTPECTGEGWMIVLRGETSQWKRSRCER